MLNWVAILRRLLNLYGVKTQQELGMAIGVPFHLKLEGDGEDDTIPWPILELVVTENNLSWDWLLTGKYYRGRTGARDDDPKRDDAPPPRPEESPQPAGDTPPRIETRELARRLLNPDASGDDAAEARNQTGTGQSTDVSSGASATPNRTGDTAPPSGPQPIQMTPGTDAELEAELVGDSVEDRDDVLRELESIRSAMQRELERVESILRDRRPRG
ncbi:MAG: hypothetical protein LIQ30_00385 [Planctomycetes bacterium]|nr:hypothetical protein [Planctomycetota bacterium]